RPPGRPGGCGGHPGAGEPTHRRPVRQTLTDTWPGGIWPGEDSLPPPRRWVRVSAWAAVGLIVGLVGLCTTLTGLLAPKGLALGAIGFLASVIGFVGASHTPRSPATSAGWAATPTPSPAGTPG